MLSQIQHCPSFLFIPALAATLLLLFHGSAAPLDEPSTQSSNALSITIEGTREHLAVGTSFAVRGILTNTRSSDIYVNEAYLRLKVPAEIEGHAGSISYWTGFLPAAKRGEKAGDPATLELKPNQPTPVFWLVDPKRLWGASEPPKIVSILTTLHNLYEQLSVEMNYLFFVPGSYRLTVTASYWNRYYSNEDLKKEAPLGVAVQSKTVDVAAPQSVILVGAAIGGLIAYMILPKARKIILPNTRRRLSAYGLSLSGAFGAMLLSAIITILLARISETQFLIRVTVTDFWGAIAIGFVANYLGVEALNKIIKAPEKAVGSDVKSEQPSEQETAARQSHNQTVQATELREGEKRANQSSERKK